MEGRNDGFGHRHNLQHQQARNMNAIKSANATLDSARWFVGGSVWLLGYANARHANNIIYWEVNVGRCRRCAAARDTAAAAEAIVADAAAAEALAAELAAEAHDAALLLLLLIL
jgi:hypothetical protein